MRRPKQTWLAHKRSFHQLFPSPVSYCGIYNPQWDSGETVHICINGPLVRLRPHVSNGLWLNHERWRLLRARSLTVCSVKRQRWRRELLTLCGINQLRRELIPQLHTCPELALEQQVETGRQLSATHCWEISRLSFLAMILFKVI